MPFNLLLFPLVGAYYILIRFKYLKYIQSRLESQRILLNAALIGIFLLAFTFIVRVFANHFFPEQINSVYALLPLKIPFIGTTLFSLFIAIVSTEVANLFLKREKAVKFSIDYIGNELELMMKSSFIKSMLLQFTLDNGKFYIGWVKELPKPSVSNYIRIIPAFSGYRDEKKELVFTTQYLSVYASYIEEGSVKDIDELNTDLVLQLNSIVSVSFFDIDMYQRFNP